MNSSVYKVFREWCDRVHNPKQPFTIDSLEDLKAWNQNPTDEVPIVLHWYHRFFFEEALMKDDIKLIVDAYLTIIEFAMICEGMDFNEAKERVDGNLEYYSNSSVHWSNKLKLYNETLNRA
jgi:hypothetical protein